MISDFPRSRPNTPALDKIAGPADLKNCSVNELTQLADELRQFLLFTVGQTGGHLGASLGVVELTLALHHLLDTPRDHLIWDVGHQAYPHKILTGRREQMLAMRMAKGLTPFPTMSESEFDSFGTGHSSTSISAALGMALANKLQGQQRKSVAVIGPIRIGWNIRTAAQLDLLWLTVQVGHHPTQFSQPDLHSHIDQWSPFGASGDSRPSNQNQ